MNNMLLLTMKAAYPYQDVKSYVIYRIIDPLLHYVFFAMIGIAFSGNVRFIIVGNILMVCAGNILFNVLTMTRQEKRLGTLLLNLATPMSLFRIFYARLLLACMDSLVGVAISLIEARFLFHIQLSFTGFLLVLLITISIVLSVSAFSLAVSSLSLGVENPNLLLNVVYAMFQIVCGVNFPVSALPGWVAVIARFMPLTNGLEAVRKVLGGSVGAFPLVMNELALGAMYILLAYYCVRLTTRLISRRGWIAL